MEPNKSEKEKKQVKEDCKCNSLLTTSEPRREKSSDSKNKATSSHNAYCRILTKEAPKSLVVSDVNCSLEQNSKHRDYMEDKVNINTPFNLNPKTALFILCDGHSSDFPAIKATEIIPGLFETALKNINEDSEEVNTIEEAFIECFAETDEELLNKFKEEVGGGGATCNVIYICIENDKKVVYSANVGDSRSVLIRENIALRLSFDHKASDPKEQKRVSKEGAIIMNGRLFGTLMVTRSLADFELKNCGSGIGGLSVIPHVSRTELDSKDRYVLIGSDGIWDVITDNESLDMVNEFEKSEDKRKLSDIFVTKAMDKGSKDNLSCIAIKLN